MGMTGMTGMTGMMGASRKTCRRVALGAVASLAWAVAATAGEGTGDTFEGIIGTVIDNSQMPALGGGKQALLDGKAVANVFVFVQPGQEHSRTALKEVAACEKEFAGKPIHWAVVVSDKESKPAIEADIKEAGVRSPVLLDVGDALYGRLHVALFPTVGITDKGFKIVAWEPFTKVQYCEVIRARIRFLLGEIDEQQMASILHPDAATQGGATEVARRHVKLGEMLLKAKSLDKALDNARKAIAADARLAAGHALAGTVLAAQGKCGEARKSFEEALKLEPKNAAATDGMKACEGK